MTTHNLTLFPMTLIIGVCKIQPAQRILTATEDKFWYGQSKTTFSTFVTDNARICTTFVSEIFTYLQHDIWHQRPMFSFFMYLLRSIKVNDFNVSGQN
jgi:hypothetical protein